MSNTNIRIIYKSFNWFSIHYFLCDGHTGLKWVKIDFFGRGINTYTMQNTRTRSFFVLQFRIKKNYMKPVCETKSTNTLKNQETFATSAFCYLNLLFRVHRLVWTKCLLANPKMFLLLVKSKSLLQHFAIYFKHYCVFKFEGCLYYRGNRSGKLNKRGL